MIRGDIIPSDFYSPEFDTQAPDMMDLMPKDYYEGDENASQINQFFKVPNKKTDLCLTWCSISQVLIEGVNQWPKNLNNVLTTPRARK